MKQFMLVGVSMLAVSTAWAGGRPKPKWCADARMVSGSIESFVKDGDVRRGLTGVVEKRCEADSLSEADWKAEEDAYAKLSARLGLTDADWADVAAWASSNGGRDAQLQLMGDATKKPWSQLDPIEQFAALKGIYLGRGMPDMPYFVDALGGKLSEAARAGYIADCIKPGLHPTDKAVAWAVCQPDIDQFDPKKVFAEMHADTAHDAADRITIRVVADEVAHALPDHANEVKKLLAKDPAYGQIFEIAKKERGNWKPDAGVLALQVAMEDALVTGSRKASDGCADKTFKAVLSSIPKIPAKAFQLHRQEKEEMAIYLNKMNGAIASGLLSEPDSYLAVNAHVLCREATKTSEDDGLVGLVYAVGSRWSGFRGPRTAAQTRIFQANPQPDDRDAKIEYPDVTHARGWFGDHNGAGGGVGGHGTVTKATAKGNKVHLEFQKHKHQEYVSLHCKSTGRIQAILDNGEVLYEETCADSKLVTSMEGQDPLDVDSATAKAVKPGMVAEIVHGVMLVAWPNEKSDTPVLVLGQPVK